MKLLFDFLPIVVLFLGYKLAGIYTATALAIDITILQLIIYYIKYQRLDGMLLTTGIMAILLGGSTLILKNDIFIKVKPTVVYWLFAVIFLGSQYFSEQAIIQRMLQQNIELPDLIWRRLNTSWALFFFAMGVANLFVIFNYSTEFWLYFKLIGIIGLTILFVIFQAIFLAKYFHPKETSHKLHSTRANHD